MKLIGRRRLLTAGAAAGVLAATGMPLQAAPKSGGLLRLGLSGARATDSWDSRTHSGPFMTMAAHGAVFDTLTQIAANGELVGELAESWQSSADARTWQFKLRKGVRFHSGKLMTPDDVIGSLALHLDPKAQSPVMPIVSAIQDMRSFGKDAVEIRLKAPNADFPFLLADYHLCIYPAEQAELAMITGNGTGLYRVMDFVPGVQAHLKRVDDHYKDGREGWFAEVELLAIHGAADRRAALVDGHVDAIDRVAYGEVDALAAQRGLRISEVSGNQHISFAMQTTESPYDAIPVRQALKHLVDRPAIVADALHGHGVIGRDTPIGPANQYFAADLPIAPYDPERARYLLDQAGFDGRALTLHASDAVLPGVADAARALQNSAAAAGLQINIVSGCGPACEQEWPPQPFGAVAWSGRLTEDWMLSTATQTGAPWNDTQWSHDRYQSMLFAARSELNSTRRRTLYQDMQSLFAQEGGAVIPAFANYVDAHTANLAHGSVGNVLGMDSGRLIERWWFA